MRLLLGVGSGRVHPITHAQWPSFDLHERYDAEEGHAWDEHECSDEHVLTVEHGAAQPVDCEARAQPADHQEL